MADEVEIAAIGTLGGLFRRTDPPILPPDAVCENCATPLKGAWCYICGQEFSPPHRSIGALFAEAFEGMFHTDGRLWKTLARLMLHPARLTHDYVEGKRAPQAPPFSVFLVVVLIFVFIGGLSETISTPRNPIGSSGTAALVPSTTPAVDDSRLFSWIKARERIALAQPERFVLVAETWEHRLAILMLPIFTGLLAISFAFKTRFRMQDHLVFSMHSLSFAGLVLSASMLLALVIGDWAMLLWVFPPIHLFVHMRGFYRTSVLGTVARMGLLVVGSSLSFIALLFALILVSLSAMSA